MLSIHRSIAAAVAAALLSSAAHAAPITLRVQSTAEPNGIGSTPVVSSDGRVVVFRSSSTNLAPGGGGTLFAYAIGPRSISALAPSANGPIFNPSVSGDGRYVAFETTANNLVPAFDSGFVDTYLLDRDDGSFQLVSRGFGGIAPNGGSDNAVVSGDGRYVAFNSLASNLVAPSTTPNREHVYVLDTTLPLVELVSRSPAFEEGNKPSEPLESSAFSADGARLVFASQAENIAPVFAGNVADVFVMTRDPSTRAMSYEMVNRSASGEPGNLSSSRGAISPNGRYVVFRTGANNILPPNGSPSDLYVRDLELDELRAVALPAGYTSCDRGRVDDAGHVVMRCAPAAPATTQQVFLARRDGSAPSLVSQSFAGGVGNASSGQGFGVSADGAVVALESLASDLVTGDLNGAADVFVIGEPAALDLLFADSFE